MHLSLMEVWAGQCNFVNSHTNTNTRPQTSPTHTYNHTHTHAASQKSLWFRSIMDFRSRLCPQAAWLQFIYMRCCNDKSANSAVDYKVGTELTHPMHAHTHLERWRIGFGGDNHAATHAQTFVLLWRCPLRNGLSCSALTDISEVSRWGQHTCWKNKCGRCSKISSSWFQQDETLWCTLDSGLLLVLVMWRMF